MAGNTIGSIFRVTTWGESHGRAIGVTVDGCPAGLDISEDDIQPALDRRRPGKNLASTTRGEVDKIGILAGVFQGKTTGSPVSLIIRNSDIFSSHYDHLKDIFRPGHGDFAYQKKYGIRDWRGGGRSSGRETTARVAAGAVAEKMIGMAGVEVLAYTRAIGGIEINHGNLPKGRALLSKVRNNFLFCPDEEAALAMEEKLAVACSEGDSLGGVVEIVVIGCPAGLGEPVFEKMDAALASALMSVGSVKAVEIGDGFSVAGMRGSEINDQMGKEGFKSNHAGGILSGITNGEEIVLRAYCKPIPSIGKEQQTLDEKSMLRKIRIQGRHDVCVLPRIVPVCEAMVSIVLADFWLRQKVARI
jgi:chorismate synthase